MQMPPPKRCHRLHRRSAPIATGLTPLPLLCRQAAAAPAITFIFIVVLVDPAATAESNGGIVKKGGKEGSGSKQPHQKLTAR